MFIASVAVNGELGRHSRVWISKQGQALAGALLVKRISPGRWFASVLIVEPTAAAGLARLIDRSPATQLVAWSEDADPILPFLRRAGRVTLNPGGVIAPGIISPPEPDPRCRLATADDLSEVVDVYRGYELEAIASLRQVRSSLEPLVLAGRAVVVEADNRIVGCIRADAVSPSYVFWGSQTVLPGFRGQGLSWALIEWAWAEAARSGRGLIWEQASSNPMPLADIVTRDLEPGRYELGSWAEVRLRPRIEFRGHRRLRRLLRRINGRRLVHRPPEPFDGEARPPSYRLPG